MYAILKTVLYFSGFFFILQSCTETAAENTSKEVITQTEEVKINPDVKMVTIKGGKYQPFYGSDSALVNPNSAIEKKRVF